MEVWSALSFVSSVLVWVEVCILQEVDGQGSSLGVLSNCVGGWWCQRAGAERARC